MMAPSILYVIYVTFGDNKEKNHIINCGTEFDSDGLTAAKIATKMDRWNSL